MGIHPKDIGKDNPRMQCVVCGKWKRMLVRNKESGEWEQIFYGGCSHCDGGQHLAAKNGDDYVCQLCCDKECARLSQLTDAEAMAEIQTTVGEK